MLGFEPLNKNALNAPRLFEEVIVVGGGEGGKRRIPKRFRPRTTRDIVKELKDRREVELQAITDQADPVSQWPLPVDDWMKRKMVVKMMLDRRRKIQRKKRVTATLLLFNE